MCDICKVQDENPEINPAIIARIIQAVEEHEQAHLEHTVVSILDALGVKEFTITRELAEEAANKLDAGGVTLEEKVSANYDALTYVIQERGAGAQNREELKPLAPGEVSADNSIAELFEKLGLKF